MISISSPTSTTVSIKNNDVDAINIDANNKVSFVGKITPTGGLKANNILPKYYYFNDTLSSFYNKLYEIDASTSVYVGASTVLPGKKFAFIKSTREMQVYHWGNYVIKANTGTFTVAGSAAGTTALTTIGNSHMAYITDTGSLVTYRYAHPVISSVGSGLAISGMINTSITALNSTDIALIDVGNKKLRVYRWDGSSWGSGYIGSELSITDISVNAKITALNSTDIALADSGSKKLRVYRWDGSSWGSGYIGSEYTFSGSGTDVIMIQSLNSNDIVVYNRYDRTASVLRWNYSEWFSVSNSYAVNNWDSGESVYAVAALSSSTTVSFEKNYAYFLRAGFSY